MSLSRARLRFNIALSMNLHFSLMLFAFLSYFLISSIPNPTAIAIYAGLIVFFAYGLYRTWKTDIVPTADLMCNGDVALCRIDRVTWQDPILCGGSYPRRADYTLFVRDESGERTFPGQLRKPEQIRALNLREGDIRHAIYDPDDPTRNTLDVHHVRWVDYERLVKTVPVVRSVLAFVTAVIVSCSAFAEPPQDASGDTIPPGATARLGTTRFRNPSSEHHVSYTPDGKTVITASHWIHVWDAAMGVIVRRIEPPNGHLYSAVLSPDGTFVATCGTDRSSRAEHVMRLWEVKTGREIRQFTGHTDMVFSLAFTADGAGLVSAADDGTVRTWSVGDGVQTRSVTITGKTRALAFAKDGRFAVVGKDGTLRIFDPTGEKTKWTTTGVAGDTVAIHFSPDGSLVCWGGADRKVHIARADTGEVVHRLAQEGGYSLRFAFSGDGTRLATADYPNRPRLWDVATGKMLHELDGLGTITVAFAPDGKTLAGVGASHAVRFWDVATGQPRPGPAGHTMAVKALAFTPDGKRLASAGDDGTVRTWDLATAREARQFSTGTDWYQSFAFSADGKWVATNGPKVWNVETGRAVAPFDRAKASGGAVSMTSDGETIATGGEPSRMWDRMSGRAIASTVKEETRTFPHVESIAVSPDGQHFAEGIQQGSFRSSGEIRIWNMGSQKCREFGGGQLHYTSLAFSPDGHSLLSGTKFAWARQGGVQLWDAVTGKSIRTYGERRMVNCVAFSPDGHFVAAGGDDGARVWDTKSGREVAHVRGHLGGVTALAFTFDGQTLATGSTDTTILLWPIKAVR